MSTIEAPPAAPPPKTRLSPLKQSALDALTDAGLRGAFWDARVLCVPVPRTDGELIRLHIPREGPLAELAKRPGQGAIVGHQYGCEAAQAVYAEVDRRRRGGAS